MKRYLSLISALTLAASSLLAQKTEKRRVAVLDFQYATVMSSVESLFGSNQDVGRGISDLLIDKLLKEGTYRVIERREIGKIMNEQNFSNSDRADSATAAKIGRLLGVDTVIVGDITQFGRDDKTTGVGGALGNWDKYGIGKVKIGKAKAVVAITARLIDVSTGEILASESGRGQSSRSEQNLLGGGGSGWTGGGGSLDMGSSNFSQTILGEAVSAAVTELAGKMSADSVKVPTNTTPVSGLVADATGNTIIINVGSRLGVKVGDHLLVTRVSKVVKDPTTGKVLRTIDAPVGDLQVTSVDEGSAVGTFSGAGAPQVGDTVKTP
jgi:curli biogenesis system outer membrane secretion channel CsgG